MWLLPRLGVGAALGLEMWRRRRLEASGRPGRIHRAPGPLRCEATRCAPLSACEAQRVLQLFDGLIFDQEYEDIWLYDLPEQEEALLEASGGDATYGEVSPELIEWLLAECPMHAEDLLSDFGSGSGRALLYLALRTGLPAIGVELSKTRCRCAETYRMLAEPFLQSQVQFLQCDLLDDGPHRDATVVLFANKLFTEDFALRALRRRGQLPRALLLLKPLELEPAELPLRKTAALRTSWSPKQPVWLYME
ncbi:unnamed protein product [Durusdinium trenchii]|uniref:Uncharacterized protein n=2 Tax=Durusdinium trenchii TaxID=1381693 RepID=A0ABP0P530_9DINO